MHLKGSPEKFAMKTALKISISINLLSVGMVIFLVLPKSAPRSLPPAREIAATSPPEPHAPPITKPDPFHWSELESTDYRTYIANLRRIECPEQTIRDIITADVDAAIFAPRREQLKQNQNGALETDLQELNHNESALIATLLGTPLNPGDVAATSAHSRAVRKKSQDTPIALPVAFANLDSAGLKLNANQLQEMANQRQDFIEKLGGPNPDPNDPAYRERWQKAQPALDAELEAMLGTAAYQKLQFESQSAAMSPSNGTKKP
jgi:hypothetical protein